LYGFIELAKPRLDVVWKEGGTLMPKLKTRLPKLCRDRKLAISWHNGERIYHGLWGTPDAEKNYRRFIAALLESPSLPLRIGKDRDVLVSELATAYLDTIEKSRMHPSHVSHFKQAIGFLVEIYGELAVNEFSPKKLKVSNAPSSPFRKAFTSRKAATMSGWTSSSSTPHEKTRTIRRV